MSEHTQTGESILEEDTGFTAGLLGLPIPGVVYIFYFCILCPGDHRGAHWLQPTKYLFMQIQGIKNKSYKKNAFLEVSCV